MMTHIETTNDTKPVFTDPDRYDPSAPRNVEVDIRGLLMMLWRRKIVVLATILIGISLAAITVSFLKPLYTARALLLIDVNAARGYSKEFEALFASIKYDNSVVLSEIEVMRSRSLAQKIILEHGLMTDPELNPRFRNTDSVTVSSSAGESGAGASSGSGGFKSLSLYKDELDSLPEDVTQRDISAVVSRFLDRLIVRSIPGSNGIQVEYVSARPDRAALIANTVVDTYIEQRLERKFASTKKLTDWLDRRLADMRRQVQDSAAAVASYKEQNNIIEGTRTVVSVEELTQLNQQLVGAKSRKAQAEGRLAQVTKLANNISEIETVPDVVNSDLIQRLKLQEADFQRQLTELSTRYGPKHPDILDVTSELRATRSKLKSEILKTTDSIKKEVELAAAEVEALQGTLGESSGERFDQSAAMVKLAELEREAESNRLIYDTFLQTYKKSDDQDDLQEPEARIISYAAVPNKPSYPNKLLIISLSAAVSLFVGLAISVLLEKLDNTYRSANQLENALGFPCFGLIPLLDQMPQKELSRYVLSKPSSTVSESVKTLRTVLGLRSFDKDKKTKVVAMTSSFPGEGKTTLSVWMGRLAAKSGEKVIVIDADLRRPAVHSSLGMSTSEGTLVDYLTGQKELDQVVKKDEASGVHVILGASVPNSALDLVSGEKMRKLVESLRQAYDLVIIDSPACLAVSDSRVLASLSDALLYAVSWDETPREVVMSGVKQFVDVGYGNMAFVLTNVDVKKHANYGYGDTVYYYGRYKEYYAN